jgi:hypothetical protein
LFDIKYSKTGDGMGIRAWSGDLANPCPSPGRDCAMIITPVWCDQIVKPVEGGGRMLEVTISDVLFVKNNGTGVKPTQIEGITLLKDEFTLVVKAAPAGYERYIGMSIDMAGIVIDAAKRINVYLPPVL